MTPKYLLLWNSNILLFRLKTFVIVGVPKSLSLLFFIYTHIYNFRKLACCQTDICISRSVIHSYLVFFFICNSSACKNNIRHRSLILIRCIRGQNRTDCFSNYLGWVFQIQKNCSKAIPCMNRIGCDTVNYFKPAFGCFDRRCPLSRLLIE